jgi:hypothetical protein
MSDARSGSSGGDAGARVPGATKHHERLWVACRELDGDYDPWGKVKRWADANASYPDCSHGCKWFYVLANKRGEHIGADWGVCSNPKSHRCGLLTFEHQGCQKCELSR